MEENRKYWLLRIENTVYGPFETQKVVDLITKGRVSEIDEATRPRDRWHYVRDVPEFMRAVELQRKIANRKKAHEATLTTSMGTATEAITKVTDEKTSEIQNQGEISKTLPVPDLSSEEFKVSQQSAGKSKSSLNKNTEPRKESSPSFKWPLTVIIVLVAVVSIFFASGYDMGEILEKGKSAFQTKDPLKFWKLKDYQKAYNVFKADVKIQEQYPLIYVSLILKNTDKLDLALSVLESNSSIKTSKPNAWINLYVTALMRKGDFGQSEAFLKSIDYSMGELSLVSLYNLGLWHYLQEEWEQSLPIFESVFEQSSGQALEGVSLYIIDAWVQKLKEESKGKAADYSRLVSFMNNIIHSESLYRYEINLMAHSLIEQGLLGLDSFSGLKADFYNFDPEMVFQRVTSPYIFDFTAKTIKKYCPALDKVSSEYIKLSCKMLANIKNLKAIGISDINFSVEEDAQFLALVSFLEEKKGNRFEANNFLIRAFEAPNIRESMLPKFVQARFCQVNGNLKCAIKNWNEILDQSEYSPTALVGIAQSYLEKGELEKAEEYYKKAMLFAQNLVSFHKLKFELEKLEEANK